MSKSNFQKFIKKDEKGSKLKEKIRQEKKKTRQETKEYFAQQKIKRTGQPVEPSKRSASELITKKGASDKPLAPSIKAKDTGEMPLNKFVAHAGVCSRRDAADLVKSGKVSV